MQKNNLITYFCWAAAIGWLIALVSMLISYQLNYGAESLSFGAFQRLASAQFYLSSTGESPLLLNPYSPIFYVLLFPITFWIPPENPMLLALITRLLCLLFVFGTLKILHMTARKFFSLKSDLNLVTLFFLVIFLDDIPLVLSVRPDALSNFFGLISFYLALRILANKHNSFRDSLLLGGAVTLVAVLKVNNLGIPFGVFLALILCQRYRTFLFSALSGGVFFFSLMATTYWISGPEHWETMMLSIKSGLITDPKVLYNIILGILNYQVIFLSPLVLFALFGLLQIREQNRAYFLLIVLSLIASFGIACFSQLKPGAAANYFYPYRLFMVLPAAVGLKNILKIDTLKQGAMWGLGIWLTALLFYPITFAGIDHVINQRYNWKKVRALVTERFPTGKIYAPHNAAGVWLFDRVHLGPWAEEVLEFANDQRHTARVLQTLEKEPFSYAIVVGEPCEDWKPAGLFEEHLRDLKKLEVREGRICLFSAS